jgi:hypothetical protein
MRKSDRLSTVLFALIALFMFFLVIYLSFMELAK